MNERLKITTPIGRNLRSKKIIYVYLLNRVCRHKSQKALHTFSKKAYLEVKLLVKRLKKNNYVWMSEVLG